MDYNASVGSPEIHDPRFAGGSTPIGGGPIGPPMGGGYAQQMQYALQGAHGPQGGPMGMQGGMQGGAMQGGALQPPFPHHMFPLPSTIGGGPMDGPIPANADAGLGANVGQVQQQMYLPHELFETYVQPPPEAAGSIARPKAPTIPSGMKSIEYTAMWQWFLLLVLLIIVFNNSIVQNLQRFITPRIFQTTTSGSTPLVMVIFNACVIGALFILILRYTNI